MISEQRRQQVPEQTDKNNEQKSKHQTSSKTTHRTSLYARGYRMEFEWRPWRRASRVAHVTT